MVAGTDNDGDIYVTSFGEEDEDSTFIEKSTPFGWTQSHRLEDALDLRLFGRVFHMGA